MLLDIIPLVDRWDESDRFVDCSTFAQRCITDVPYSTGPIEEVWYPLGREFDGPGASRYERYKIVERDEVMYEEFMMDDADMCVVAFGIAARVCKNAIMAAREKGIKVGMIRPITLWPFPKDALKKAAGKVKSFLSVELNMGQMVDDVKLAIDCQKPVYFYGRTGGVIMTPDEVLNKIEEIEKGEAKQW